MKKNYMLLLIFIFCIYGVNAQNLNYAYCFDGENDFAELDDSNPSTPIETGIFGDNIDNDSFTIEFWVKDNNNGSGNYMLSKHYDSGTVKEGFFIRKNPSTGSADAGIADNTNSWTMISGNRLINDNDWHHMAITFDIATGRFKFYIDGYWEGTSAPITAVFGNTVKFKIASSYLNTFFGGSFDEIKVYSGPNAVRTLAQINIDKNIELDTASPPQDLIGYYRCNEGIPNNYNWEWIILQNVLGNSDRDLDLINTPRIGPCSNWVDSVPNSLLSVDTFETPNNGLQIYPNPTKSIVQIKGLKLNQEFVIHNSLGAIVKKGMVSNTSEISVANLSKGMYFLTLSDNSRLKFIKQ